MTTQNKKNNRSKTQIGLFLFFVTGLFLLQIAFAFTIHGDIGPQTNLVPGLDRLASPVIIGRIDTLVSDARLQSPVKVAPEGAFAPATRDFTHTMMPMARIDTEISVEHRANAVRKIEGDRFFEYRIQPGDTLEGISQKLFGNIKMVQALVRINRITDERALRLGENIRVPSNGILETVQIN